MMSAIWTDALARLVVCARMGEMGEMGEAAAMAAAVPPIPRRDARRAAWATAHPGNVAAPRVAAVVRPLTHVADPHGMSMATIPTIMMRHPAAAATAAMAATVARHRDARAVVATTSTTAMVAGAEAAIPTSRQRVAARARMAGMTATTAGRGALPGGGVDWANWSAICRAS